MIPYSRQFISKKDKSYVLKALSSDFLTTGPLVKKFEEKLREEEVKIINSSLPKGLKIEAIDNKNSKDSKINFKKYQMNQKSHCLYRRLL